MAAAKKKKNKSTLPAVLIITALLALAAFFFLQGRIPPIATPEKTVTPTPPADTPARATTPPALIDTEADRPAALSESAGAGNPCQQPAREISAFFQRLDQQEYIGRYQLGDPGLVHFSGILKKLFANPPIVVRESDDLFSIMKNMVHFYRVLGKKDIQLIKDTLTHEAEGLEPLLALFYRWSELEPRCRDQGLPAGSLLTIDLPLASLYEYAGFFLNTVGGQSYLNRRVPRLRLLIKYYAILILDRANDEKMNRYGIDIRYPVDSLIKEIEASSQLTFAGEYLDRMAGLQEKYQTRYGRSAGTAPGN
ncbi:MAG: hypothetical protein L3J03_06455 [Desulfobacterales bacterium]|nr:hypothetical protein [Desulfobacterales bacterium]